MDEDLVLVPSAPDQRVPPQIQAEITVGGDLSGQLAIGENIVQLRIDNMHGDVIQQVAAPPNVRRRPSPLRVVPRRPPRFVDRTAELSLLLAYSSDQQPVCVHGPRGVGKSTLLRQFANAPDPVGTGGVAHLPAAGLQPDDLAQSLFDLFYETDTPYRPSRGELTHRLRALDAVVAIDDVGLDRDAAAAVADLLTGSAVVMASTSAVLDRTVPLAGLPEDEAIDLMAATAGRGLSAGERALAAGLAQGRDARPLALMQIAAAMPTEASIDADPLATAAAVLASLDDDHARIVQPLAAVPAVALDHRQLTVLLGRDVTDVDLEALELRGVVQTEAHGGGLRRWSIADGMPDAAAATWDLEPARRRLYDVSLLWAWRAAQPPMTSTAEADAVLAVADDAAARGRHDLALPLVRGVEPVYAAHGMWTAWGRTLDDLVEAAQVVGDRRALAFGLHQAGTRLLCLGKPLAGAGLLKRALDLRRDLGDLPGEAVTRRNLELVPAGVTPPPRWRRPSARWVRGLLALAVAVAAVVGGGRALGLLGAGDDEGGTGAEQESDPGTEREGDGDGTPTVVEVPDVVGQARSDAEHAIEDAGLEVDVIEQHRSDAEPGTVFAQDPDAGTEVEQGETVVLTVARGVRLPDVVGETADDASATLEDLPVEVTLVYVEDDDVDAGTVVAQDPTAGSVVDVGSELRLDVAGVRMPDAAGVELQAALEELRFLQLPVTAEPREAVARVRTVLEQFPEAGAIVAPGTEVELVWAQVRIPTDLVGMDVEDAAERLAELGLEVTRESAYSPSSEDDGKVIEVAVEDPYRPGDLVSEPVEVQLTWRDPAVIG